MDWAKLKEPALASLAGAATAAMVYVMSAGPTWQPTSCKGPDCANGVLAPKIPVANTSALASSGTWVSYAVVNGLATDIAEFVSEPDAMRDASRMQGRCWGRVAADRRHVTWWGVARPL